jgi:ribosomal protein S17E
MEGLIMSLKDLYELDHEISKIRKDLKSKEEARDCLLAGILSKNITTEEGYALLPKTKNVRVPIIQKFRELLGEQFDSMIKIQIGKVEKILSKEIINSACYIDQVVSYIVVDQEGTWGEGE